MNNKLTNMKNNIEHQKGVAIVVVLVVLLAMTILGLTATDSSSLQALMARNNQFRMETFNASNAELDGQIDFYKSAAVGTLSQPIAVLLDSPIGTKLEKGVSTLIVEKAENTSFEKEISLTRNSGCANTGNTIGFGKPGLVCTLMRVDSSAKLTNTNVKSDQVQTFSIKSF